MKKILLVLLGTLTLSSSFAQTTKEHIKPKVVGGVTASQGEFPWIAAIRVDWQNGKGNVCGGSVINKEWILTAAHCVTDEDNSALIAPIGGISVYTGINNIPHGASNWFNDFSSIPSENTFLAKAIYIHPRYSRDAHGGVYDDIALIQLARPTNASIITPLLANDLGYVQAGTNTIVAGWGLTDPNSDVISYTLQKTDLPIVDTFYCDKSFGGVDKDHIICAGYAQGGKDACNGDSGGPLMVKVNDQYRLAGVVSFGGSNCGIQSASYGVYQNVAKYQEWLEQVLGIKLNVAAPIKPTGPTGSTTEPAIADDGDSGGSLGYFSMFMLLALVFIKKIVKLNAK